MSKQIVDLLDKWRDSEEALSEALFLSVYGLPALQAAVGVDPQSAKAGDVSSRSRAPGGADRGVEIPDRPGRSQGGDYSRPALCRHGAGNGGRAQPRGLAPGSKSDSGRPFTLAQFKTTVREQFRALPPCCLISSSCVQAVDAYGQIYTRC